ncbi:AAA family ATPase [Fimbriiglobus ruber]|uniref:Cell division protein FtsH n=1 Tax=Fimbriiglobus ruber TaxID=1908690 RepID=A0A225DTX1_9BACT|nr:ATP-binding protein [Fimbriiglobus ruber]OWK43054.1 Cell division protein FtsH [Fimbriiglobus ruber]
MATAEQLKALLKSYIDGDGEQFLTVSMQVAAHAARRGQGRLAQDIRELIDQAKRQAAPLALRPVVPIARPAGELADLIQASYPKTRLADMVLGTSARASLDRVIVEYRQQDKLRAHGLSARRKLLLVGPPGTGKTMTAAALAGELKFPLLAARLDGLITKFMGETAAKLRLVFDTMVTTRGVYLFDEFDAIGSDRGRKNDVGEMRRVLNSFLQFLETDDSDSLILAATNHQEALDPALFRRFDDVIRYGLPEEDQIEQLAKNRLNSFGLSGVDWDKVRAGAAGLSYAEVTRACMEAAKVAVLSEQDTITTGNLLSMLRERTAILGRDTST